MKIPEPQYECIKQYRNIEVGTVVELEYYGFNRFIIMNGNNHPIIDKKDVLVYFKTKEEK